MTEEGIRFASYWSLKCLTELPSEGADAIRIHDIGRRWRNWSVLSQVCKKQSACLQVGWWRSQCRACASRAASASAKPNTSCRESSMLRRPCRNWSPASRSSNNISSHHTSRRLRNAAHKTFAARGTGTEAAWRPSGAIRRIGTRGEVFARNSTSRDRATPTSKVFPGWSKWIAAVVLLPCRDDKRTTRLNTGLDS
jgi:hypothetical protein